MASASGRSPDAIEETYKTMEGLKLEPCSCTESCMCSSKRKAETNGKEFPSCWRRTRDNMFAKRRKKASKPTLIHPSLLNYLNVVLDEKGTVKSVSSNGVTAEKDGIGGGTKEPSKETCALKSSSVVKIIIGDDDDSSCVALTKKQEVAAALGLEDETSPPSPSKELVDFTSLSIKSEAAVDETRETATKVKWNPSLLNCTLKYRSSCDKGKKKVGRHTSTRKWFKNSLKAKNLPPISEDSEVDINPSPLSISPVSSTPSLNCGQQAVSNGYWNQEASMEAGADDVISVMELASYLEHGCYIPKEMSTMAEMMYT